MPRSTTTTEILEHRRAFLRAGAMAFGAALLPASARGQQAARITTVDLGGATLLQGAGCNVLALAGPDGALMIDGGLAANAEVLLAAVKRATGGNRINTLINTHWHPEQTGANDLVGKAGGVIFAHEKTKLAVSSTVYSSVMFSAARQAGRRRRRAVTGRWSLPGSRSSTATCPRRIPTRTSTFTCRGST